MLRRRILSLLPWAVLSLSAFAATAHAAGEPEPIRQEDIMPYLEQVIGWYRATGETEAIADNGREVLLKNHVRQSAATILEKSFAFARAQAAILKLGKPEATAPPDEAQNRRTRLRNAAAEADARLAELQSRLDAGGLNAADREKIGGQVKLAQAQKELLQTILKIFSTEGDTSGSLTDQINALYRTVAEVAPEQAAVKNTATAGNSHVDANDGMLHLVGVIFSYARKKSDIDQLIKLTAALDTQNRAFINSLRAALRAALADGNTLANSQLSGGKSMAEYRKSLDLLLTRYKMLSAAIVPLGEVSAALAGPERDLREWSNLLDQNWTRVVRLLALRIAVLAVAITIPLILSALAQRAINRYVQDLHRKRQLRIARRSLLFIALTFVILANFLTEFSSLATFAGFLTAGLAVAMQTVLISLAAHFFYFGRYGVRAGDRITVTNVTGEVLQVGMLRLYLQEVEEKNGHWTATGKVVAFPNSILFQPTAFYKHMR